MAAHIHRHGQAGHVGGGGLDGQAQTGGPAAEALGADAQGIDLLQQLLLRESSGVCSYYHMMSIQEHTVYSHDRLFLYIRSLSLHRIYDILAVTLSIARIVLAKGRN